MSLIPTLTLNQLALFLPHSPGLPALAAAEVAAARSFAELDSVPSGAEGQPHPDHGAGFARGGRDREAVCRALPEVRARRQNA